MSIKRFALLCVFSAAASSYAGGFLDGFIGGAATSAANDIGNKMQADTNLEGQKALMQQQHDLEMQRIRAEFDMRRQFEERQRLENARQSAAISAAESASVARRKEAERRDAERLAKNEQDYDDYLNKQHPDWRELMNSPRFVTWFSALPAAERSEFSNRKNVYYASSVISRFKDTVKKPGKMAKK